MKNIPITTNVPVDLALARLTGEMVRTKLAGIRQRFTTIDGRSFLLSEQHAYELEQRLRELDIRRGERILIHKENAFSSGGTPTTRLNVYRATGLIGQQADGTFRVPAIPGAIAPRDRAPGRCARCGRTCPCGAAQ